MTDPLELLDRRSRLARRVRGTGIGKERVFAREEDQTRLEDRSAYFGCGLHLLLEELLAFSWGLPDLGEFVPLEVDVTDPGGVGDPGADQVRAGADDAYDEAPTPVVELGSDDVAPGQL
ncbi:MAG TPA: hypothetical protein VMU64_12885 [Acidimicrobiales bacterium]|nr:hypothetical protein [Acidimicrobiales bacterium]